MLMAPIASLMDTLNIAASGLSSAEVLLSAAAHNVWRIWGPRPFHPIRVVQQEPSSGGSTARIEQVASPAPVDLVHETLEQFRATIQHTASLCLIAVEFDLRGQRANLLA